MKMWNIDFELVLKYLKKAFSDVFCLNKMEASAFGDRVVITRDDVTYLFFIKTHALVRVYDDTWRNRDHYDVILEGDTND